MFKKLKNFSIPFAVVVVTLLVFSSLNVNSVKAATTPTTYGSAWYVSYSWTTNFNNAYIKGQNSQGGGSGSTLGSIIIDFGRQYYNGSTWGVLLTDGTFISYSTATTIAEYFANGYNSDHTTATDIAVSTNNDDVNWVVGDSRWTTSAAGWANVVNNAKAGTSSDQYVSIIGGNDIESWIGQYPPWVASGSDSNNWVNTFDSDTSNTLMLNFGSDGNAENPYSSTNTSGWTAAQVYNVSWGISDAVATPEIYNMGCANDWKAIYNSNNSLYLWGSMSEKGGISWQTSWADLNSVLPNNIGSTAMYIQAG